MIGAAEQSTSLDEIVFGDFFAKRSTGTEPDAGLTNALSACLSAGIEVVSLLPERVELRVPSDLTVISPLQELVTQLEAGLSPEVSEAISRAFREMLCNAIEYGGHLDPAAASASDSGTSARNSRCRLVDGPAARYHTGNSMDAATADDRPKGRSQMNVASATVATERRSKIRNPSGFQPSTEPSAHIAK